MKRIKILFIAIIVLEFVALFCALWHIPFNPYGFYWFVCVFIVIGLQYYEIFFKRK